METGRTAILDDAEPEPGPGQAWVRADGEEAWLTVKQLWRHARGDAGADVAFQCRGHDAALATALKALRPRGSWWTSASTRPARSACGWERSSTTTG